MHILSILCPQKSKVSKRCPALFRFSRTKSRLRALGAVSKANVSRARVSRVCRHTLRRVPTIRIYRFASLIFRKFGQVMTPRTKVRKEELARNSGNISRKGVHSLVGTRPSRGWLRSHAPEGRYWMVWGMCGRICPVGWVWLHGAGEIA